MTILRFLTVFERLSTSLYIFSLALIQTPHQHNQNVSNEEAVQLEVELVGSTLVHTSHLWQHIKSAIRYISIVVDATLNPEEYLFVSNITHMFLNSLHQNELHVHFALTFNEVLYDAQQDFKTEQKLMTKMQMSV